jgi:hypothetical protein
VKTFINRESLPKLEEFKAIFINEKLQIKLEIYFEKKTFLTKLKGIKKFDQKFKKQCQESIFNSCTTWSQWKNQW